MTYSGNAKDGRDTLNVRKQRRDAQLSAGGVASRAAEAVGLSNLAALDELGQRVGPLSGCVESVVGRKINDDARASVQGLDKGLAGVVGQSHDFHRC